MVDKIINGDAIEVMAGIPAKSIPLIIADPPYNIGKAAWDKIDNYLDWCGQWLKACERILADNGSMYVFHNDKEFIADLMIWIRENTDFVFKNEITIEKDDASYVKDRYGSMNHFRNYISMAEYILFYTFGNRTEWDRTGLQRIYSNRDCFLSIKRYMRAERKKAKAAGYDIKKLAALCGVCTTMLTQHYFSDSQWCLPTAEMYGKLQMTGYFQRPYDSISKEHKGLRQEYEELRLEYEELRLEYEELRLEYEELRYTFDGSTGMSNVWHYSFSGHTQHPTQKPVDLIENIIKHSSNEGDVILDPFSGSGTTAVAAIRTGRHYIGVDTDASYCEIAERRIVETHQILEAEARQGNLWPLAAGD